MWANNLINSIENKDIFMEKVNIKMHPRLQAAAPMNLAKVIGGFDSTKSLHPRLQAAAPMNLAKVIGGFDSTKALHPRLQAAAPMNLAKVIGGF